MARMSVAIVAALAGCGDIIGLDGYSQGDGSATVDANAADTGGGGDAKADVVKMNDAGNDVVVTMCTGGVCVSPLPSGWAWAMYVPDSRPGCVTGYGSPSSVDEGINAGAATCGCTCTTTQPSCATGNVTITTGVNAGCKDISNQTEMASGGCHALSAGINDFNATNPMMAVTGPAPSGGSCAANPSQTVPPVAFDHQGQTCTLTATPGGGCVGGNICIPSPTPFAACVSQAGDNTCPSGFPNKHSVGTMVNDTRGCTTCGCTLDAGTCGGNLTVYRENSVTCTSATSSTVTVDGTCHSVGAHNWNDYKYVPTTNGSCAGSSVTANGNAVFSDLTTVCCM